MMEQEEAHEVDFELMKDGSKSWHCPTCGRHILVKFDKEKQQLEQRVLVKGNMCVQHFGSSGGVRVDRTEITLPADKTEGSEELRDAVDDALSHLDLDELLGSEE